MNIALIVLCVLVALDLLVRFLAYKKLPAKKKPFFDLVPRYDRPVVVQTPDGWGLKCWGIGKEFAIVGGDYKGAWDNQKIPLEDFRRDYVLPDHLRDLVDQLLIEKNTAVDIEEALQELNH